VSDTPDEPEAGEPGPGEGGGPDDPDSPQRGWLDPDDRVWRHPSELSPDRVAEPVLLAAPPRHRYRGPLMVLIGAAAVGAVAAFLIVLLSPASSHLPSTTRLTTVGPLTTLAGQGNAVPANAAAAGHSMVELRATSASGTVTLVGIAVAEGGLVVTTADFLGALQSISMVDADGSLQPASVVAIDHTSDLALVNVPAAVPVAPFADDTALASGSPDVVLGFESSRSGPLTLQSTGGSVTAVGTPVSDGPAGGMPAITSSATTAPVVAGEPLLNAAGAVVGILYDPDPSNAAAVTFLPTQLVVGVADDLRSTNRVVPGWLGMEGANGPNGSGAVVEAVTAGGPAAGRLRAGEVITAVDGQPVQTMADLRGRIYVLSPGAVAALSVQDGVGNHVVDVTLGKAS
jgi:S1-C subfamily serine protease